MGFQSPRSIPFPPLFLSHSHYAGGRPDTMSLIKSVYDSWGAEVRLFNWKCVGAGTDGG
jgi:hypothetical protein